VGLEHSAWLEENRPALANQIKALSWVSDGVDDTERKAAEALIAMALGHRDVFYNLTSKQWIRSHITTHGAAAIDEIYSIAYYSPALAIAMLEKSWVQDDITRDETVVIDRLESIVRAEDESLQQQVIRKVIEILGMPFLDTVESADASAIRALESLEDAGSAEFLELMDHPTLSDGIDNEEAKLFVLLGGTNRYKPELVPVLLDGTSVFKEERIINLPHSGEVLLAIIRFHDHTGPNMDYLEHAVRHHEGFMGEALPTNYVAWYFVDYTSSGWHEGTHIASNPERDPAHGEYWRAPRHAAHETGHYYWTDSQAWIDEGAADMLVILSENTRTGRPLVHNREQCTLFNTISEIADVEKGSDAYDCSYRLGQRLFLDLYHVLGEAAFRQAFRSLYLKRLRDDPTDDCEGTQLGICHLESTFKSGVSDEVAVKVDKVIGHWYYGEAGTHDGDRAVLAALYREMGGSNWSNNANWLSAVHIGKWHGIATDADGRVIELNLEDNALSGQIPPELGNLANLRELLLGYNHLRGPIPPELGSLTKLTRLELDYNGLTGAIPSSLGNFTQLTRLELNDNGLTGDIPSSFGNLTHLIRLELDGNRLSGSIPTSLSNLTALRFLRLAGGNRYSGCIPLRLNIVADNDLANLGLTGC